MSEPVLIDSVFKKRVFCAFFHSGVFFSWKSVFSAFFHQNVFFYNDGKIIVYTATYCNCEGTGWG